MRMARAASAIHCGSLVKIRAKAAGSSWAMSTMGRTKPSARAKIYFSARQTRSICRAP